MNIPQGPILIVEDVPQIRELLEVTLRFEGYPVVTAKNGKEALDMVAEEKPTLVITDILMPKMDGFSMVYRLRSNPETRDIPIVFLSATYVTREDKEFALSLGAVRFMEKPVDTPEFLITIGEILAEGPTVSNEPISELKFYTGYRERLEHKLRQKNQQIARTERLLKTLPEEQRPAFEALLRESKVYRDDINQELDEIIRAIKEREGSGSV
ncbi:MAG: response regulator [Anaerolineales bacterium]|nr:response regulator [Anaerolineales bacterium]